MRQRLAIGVAVGMVVLVALATTPVAAETGEETFTLVDFLYGLASGFDDIAEFFTSFADFLAAE